eukprot:Plantae.Rhodophyta-Purpureofilum_apyrenoidigerum.ctg28382.p1 GENE.Plantae.Rhodophyta-Purpureofilum_apyrenoidigerum.ctg28382~~Plantae.Rhodophyta-Purpureofilum_apyrenoidigerum.ctg28382.p1  ORF type:complete len:423 (+),score=90.50 Plantae.Rhodophyta-Purpureofilum_apyrenoidigerum.ctg28382:128-1396(+)
MKLSRTSSIIGLLVFGTGCSILAKLIYYAHGPGLYAKDERFEKPWFQVFAMFVGMSLCIIIDKRTRRTHSGNEEEKRKLLAGVSLDAEQSTSWKDIAAINWPTIFDLLATGLSTTGLLYTSVSVYQMLRGAQLIFTALLSIIFLKRKLDKFNWTGILISITGIALVGMANVYAEKNPKSQQEQLFGVMIIIAGQIMQASQVVCEEFLLRDLKMSSVRIVAWEGLFGILHMVVWVLPVAYFLNGRDHGHLEDTLDSAYIFLHTWQVATVVFADMLMMLFYNVCGMSVTNGFSAVHRVIIETLRTLCVWVIDLFLYYFVTRGGFGEAWVPYSWLQLGGFCLLVIGTLTYNYRQIVFEKEHDIVEVSADQVDFKASSKPVIFSHGHEEDEEGEEEVHRGSYYGHTFGSAAHSPFIAVVRDIGSPH